MGRFREADPGSEAMAALAIQGQMMAQLSYIVDQLKACTIRDNQCAVQRVM